MSLAFDPSHLSVAREILEFLGAAPNRTLGQNFLVNSGILDKIAATAKLEKSDSVLEIGPGLGALTVRLIRDGGHVTAIEKDMKFAAYLTKQLAPHDFFLLEGDALEAQWDDLKLPETGVKLVANLPYSISKPILRRIVEEWRPHLASATVLVQREVANRLVAEPGSKDYGPLSIMAKLHANTKKAFDVSPGSFMPPPEVVSTVVHFEMLAEPSLHLEDEAAFWRVVRAAFAQRRKNLGNTLKPLAPREKLDAAFESTRIDPRRRGETLSLAEFAALAEALR